VNKDKILGQKDALKAVIKTKTVTAAQEDTLHESLGKTERGHTGKVDQDNNAGTSALGSLGMLGDYSSSEDSDQ